MGTAVVTSTARRWRLRKRALARFVPTRENGETHVWWNLSIPCLENMLGVLGFDVVHRVRHEAESVIPGREA